MSYLALDISSKTGWAWWDGKSSKPILGMKPLVGWSYDTGSMLELYRLWLSDFFRIYKPTHVGIEAWFIAAHLDAPTIGKQIALAAFTQWACKSAGIKVDMIAAATWRKSWYGSARGKSAEFKVKAVEKCALLGWEAADHNAAEAGGILDHLIVNISRQMPPWRLAETPNQPLPQGNML